MKDVEEFAGEYLGGHVNYPDVGPALIQLGEEQLFVAPYSPLSHTELGQPFLSVPYGDIVGVQSVPYERISTLRFLALSATAGLLWRKNEHILTIGFKDEAGIEQTMAFKLRYTKEAHASIYRRLQEQRNPSAQQHFSEYSELSSAQKSHVTNRRFKIVIGTLSLWCLVPAFLAAYAYLLAPGQPFLDNLFIYARYFLVLPNASILWGVAVLAYAVWRLRMYS
jgi:hypothetical protein